jgi:galactose mutarotase-like enzyme
VIPIVLEHGAARLEVAVLGAEARRWSVGGVELLWRGDAAIWGEISPILFPIVGWTRDGARVNRVNYPLGLHGFARHKPFEVLSRSGDHVRLVLVDDPATRALYPFPFQLGVDYRLGPETLTIALEVENPGASPLPYACGLHPGFRWPVEGDLRHGAVVRFAQPETGEVPVIAPGGLFSEARRKLNFSGRDLPLSDELFASDALCFLNARSRWLEFLMAGGATIQMDFSGFDHCALWTRPHAPFLSLEAWTGHGDPEGFTGDIFEKPSMKLLAPGEKGRHEAVFRFGR